MIVEWTAFKTFVQAKSLSIQFTEDNAVYRLLAVDGTISFQCVLFKANTNEALEDFETNFKALGNKPVIQTQSAFAAKTIGTKRIFKRVMGMKSNVVIGDTDLIWECTYDWAKFMAIEIINGEIGDTVCLYVLDKHTSPFYGVPDATLNQFGFNTNISEKFYRRDSEFDADIYAGLQIKIVYTSISIKTVGINFVLNEVKT